MITESTFHFNVTVTSQKTSYSYGVSVEAITPQLAYDEVKRKAQRYINHNDSVTIRPYMSFESVPAYEELPKEMQMVLALTVEYGYTNCVYDYKCETWVQVSSLINVQVSDWLKPIK